MDDLITEFIAESREMLDALGGEIVAWEAQPQDRARLDAIFRFVHTVKGNCGFFDLPRLKILSHAAEDALAAVRSGKRRADSRLVSAVLAVIDRIGELVLALETGETLASADDAPLIAALSATDEEPEAGPAALPSGQRAVMRTIRLPVDLLDRMMNAVSDLVLARNELARRLRDVPDGSGIEGAFDRVSTTIAEIRDAVTRTRMQRIDNLFAPLPRMVRDLAAETGKPVALEIDGGDVELDREMIEMIRDPLTHIVRNAIGHGIEPAEVRRAAGKPETGSLKVCARQAGNQILIEICDDGGGIDGDRLVGKALAAGLIPPERAAQLTPAQKTALIFEPGLSTAAEVTALSGRGVGMDVVRANVERIGGLVDVDTRLGEGVRLALRVPLTLTIIPALTVAAGGQAFAIPRSAIEEIVRAQGGTTRIESVGGSSIATVRGRRVPLVSLSEVLGWAESGSPDASLILLKTAGGAVYALAVDQVRDHEELVVKPAAPAVMATGLYAGTTLADDGQPVLLLDPPGIAASAGLRLGRVERDEAPAETASGPDGTPALLFRAFDGSRRAVGLAAVERIEDVGADRIRRGAGRLHVALGERILPLVGCGAEAPEGGKIRILRLSDGISEIAYGFADVIDIVSLGREMAPAAIPGEVMGVSLVAGEQVELLDLHWLFAEHAGATSKPRPICAIPAGDPWLDTFLRPIVEASGYRVVRPDEPEAESAELVIVADEEAPAARAGSARILKIRSAADPAGPGDDSIHRYDRAALLTALAGGGGRRRKRR
jgi:two-component system chemotaxis sensor kinase CheA